MKKLLLPICTVLMCMTSCKKEGNDILTLVMEEYSSDAKLHLDNDNYTVWDNGDHIWLNEDDQVITVGPGASILVDRVSNTYTAIYPFAWASSNTRVAYPQVQKYEVTGDGQRIVAPMAGFCGEGESILKFRNLGSILAVEVTNSTGEEIVVKKIDVIADNDVKLCGSYSIDYSDYSISYVNRGSHSVSLNCGSGVSIASSDSKMFYIALPPVSAKLTIKVYDANDAYYCYAKVQGTAHTLARSCGYNAGITIDNSTEKRQYAPFSNQVMYTSTNGEYLCSNYTLGDAILHLQHRSTNVEGKCFDTYDNNIVEIPNYKYEYYNNMDNYPVTFTFPSTVTSIGQNAFQNNPHLKYVSMLGISSINYQAFNNCTGLETVILGPNTNISLGNGSFINCSGIINFYCYSTVPPTLGENVFSGSSVGSATLHVPEGKASEYRSTGWNVFGTIVDDL